MGRRQIFTPIAEDLKRRIAEGEFTLGQPLPPERDLAERYEVSRLTLRKALALLQEEGLLIRERGRGTTVAAGIASGSSSRRPSLLYVGHTDEHVHKDLYLAVARYARAAGARLELVELEELDTDGEDAPWRALLRDAHAVIVQTNCMQALLPHLPPERTALYAVGVFDPNGDPGAGVTLSSVVCDRERAARIATARLLKAGHKRVAACAAVGLSHHAVEIVEATDAALSRGDPAADGSPLGGNSTADGYRVAMHSGNRGDDQIYLTIPWRHGDEDGYEAELMAQLKAMGRSRPTGIVCDLDFRAASVYHVADEMGLSIPDELSVVGIGNTPWCRALRPALSSVSYQEDAMARTILGLAMLPEGGSGMTLHIEPLFVGRSSIAVR